MHVFIESVALCINNLLLKNYASSTLSWTVFPLETRFFQPWGEGINHLFLECCWVHFIGVSRTTTCHKLGSTNYVISGEGENLWSTGATKWAQGMIQQWNTKVMRGRGEAKDTKWEKDRSGRRRWSVREVDRKERDEWTVGERAIEMWEEETGCYLGGEAVRGLPVLQHCHLALMASRSARRGGTSARAMGAKASAWRITDMWSKQGRVDHWYWHKEMVFAKCL